MNLVDLDSLDAVYKNLFIAPPSPASDRSLPTTWSSRDFNNEAKSISRTFPESDLEVQDRFQNRNDNNMDEDDQNLHKDFEFIRPNFQKASTNYLNLLIYLLIFLIILMLLFLIGICCYLCCKRRNSYLYKNDWFFYGNKQNSIQPVQYGEKRSEEIDRKQLDIERNQPYQSEINQAVKSSRIASIDLTKKSESNEKIEQHRRQTIPSSTIEQTEDWFKALENGFQMNRENIEFRIKEEKEFTNNPRTGSYYMCKKVIQPATKANAQEMINRVDILNLEDVNQKIDNEQNKYDPIIAEQRLWKRKEMIPSQKMLDSSSSLSHRLIQDHPNKLNPNPRRRKELLPNTAHKLIDEDVKQVSLSKKNEFNPWTSKQSIYLDGFNQINQKLDHTISEEKIIDKQSETEMKTKPQFKYRNNLQRKSAFYIAYNSINDRTNISSESDKTIFGFLDE